MPGDYPKLRVAVFADGASRDEMIKRKREGFVSGFTTNPTLMAKAGVRNYEDFARFVLSEITDLPISFEVLSDDFAEMERQAELRAQGRIAANVRAIDRRSSALMS